MLRYLAVATAILSAGVMVSPSFAQSDLPAELVKRLEAEKVARKACKTDICKAFASPGSGAPVSCSFTKTWLRDQITSRVVGGSYIWGYGHTKCTFNVNLDRGEVAKSRKPEAGKATFSEHTVVCDVDDKDPTKGVSFQMKSFMVPAVSFDKGIVTAVALDGLKTEGSTAASAALSSVMAFDKVSGVVSKSLTKELNDFLTAGCKEEGIEIAPLK